MYNKIFFSVLSILLLTFLVLPYLLSSKSFELTILGFVIIIGLVYKLGQIIAHKFEEK